MAKKNENYTETPYTKIENIVLEKVFTLEAENSQLRSELVLAKAKLEVYERIATVTGTKSSLGFGPPIERE
ncbi:MAG: hypothetical protein K2P14_03625 [Anaeroplasmataceae bacterium]|nr:hypothetical protein [Anaeroplasmataceae bacterium]